MEASFNKQLVEALIVASDEPLSENKIASILEEITPGQVKKIIEELNADYIKTERAFFLSHVAGGYQYTTNPELAPWIKKMFRGRIKNRLSQAALEALSIIVFRQPISRVEVDAIRGVNSGGVVKNLLERNLITITGRADGPGKPLLYGTTREFLQYLGINEISELPKPKEIEEIMGKLDVGQTVSTDILDALTDSGVFSAAEGQIEENKNQQVPHSGQEVPIEAQTQPAIEVSPNNGNSQAE